MRFLRKSPCSKIIRDSLRYRRKYTKNNNVLKAELSREQYGYCAYTEKYLMPMDSVDVEHFDSSLKGTLDDHYRNWYAVIHKVNQKKGSKSVEDFQPMLAPDSDELMERIQFKDNLFMPVNPDDNAVKNLISYIGANNDVVVEQRAAHLSRLRAMRDCLEGPLFFELLRSSPENTSFLSAVIVEFDLDPAEILRDNAPEEDIVGCPDQALT